MNYSTLEQTVLGLPKTERAHLLQLLLDSLDTPSENEVQEAWLAQANRRAAEIDSGKVILVSGEQLEKEVQALLKLIICSIPIPMPYKSTKNRWLIFDS